MATAGMLLLAVDGGIVPTLEPTTTAWSFICCSTPYQDMASALSWLSKRGHTYTTVRSWCNFTSHCSTGPPVDRGEMFTSARLLEFENAEDGTSRERGMHPHHYNRTSSPSLNTFNILTSSRSWTPHFLLDQTGHSATHECLRIRRGSYM